MSKKLFVRKQENPTVLWINTPKLRNVISKIYKNGNWAHLNGFKQFTKVSSELLKAFLSYCLKNGKIPSLLTEKKTKLEKWNPKLLKIERELTSILINISTTFHKNCSKHFDFLSKNWKIPLFVKKKPMIQNCEI